jgi:glycosyltransferase involved in cell wall biosynthesis
MSTYYTDPPVAARKICVVYDMIFELFPQCFEEDFWKMTLQRQREAIVSADKIICVSENTRKDIVRLWGVSENRCRTIYIGGATAQAAGEEGPVSHDKPFLLYVGDFRCAYKNFEFVLAGLGPEAGKTSAGLDLVVVSRVVPNEEEKTRFASLLSPERLRFVPDCSDGELRAYYRDCAAFIYPSLYEGFGLPVQEALCQGAPVVCSNAASLPEVGGDAVYYFDPTSAMQFRQALDQALAEGWNDSVVFRRKAQAALFSWDRTAKDYVAVFREVCDPHFINAAKV